MNLSDSYRSSNPTRSVPAFDPLRGGERTPEMRILMKFSFYNAELPVFISIAPLFQPWLLSGTV